MAPSKGFTLVELIIVITLMSAVGVLVARLMVTPFQQYEDASSRAELTSLANAAVNRVVIDLQTALPNSVRVDTSVSGVAVLEMLRVVDGGRYRFAEGSDALDLDSLAPETADASFHVLGGFAALSAFNANHRVVINPRTRLELYAAASDTTTALGIMTPSTTTLTLTDAVADPNNEDRVTLDIPFEFDPTGQGSIRKRVYVIDTAVTYRCSETTGELHRYTGYSIGNALSTAEPSGNKALVLNQLESCDFIYTTGISQRLGLVTLSLTVENNDERVSLVKQVRIFNVP